MNEGIASSRRSEWQFVEILAVLLGTMLCHLDEVRLRSRSLS